MREVLVICYISATVYQHTNTRYNNNWYCDIKDHKKDFIAIQPGKKIPLQPEIYRNSITALAKHCATSTSD